MLKTFLFNLARNYLVRRGYIVRLPGLIITDLLHKPVVQGCIFLSKEEYADYKNIMSPLELKQTDGEPVLMFRGYEVYPAANMWERGEAGSTWTAGPIRKTTATV